MPKQTFRIQQISTYEVTVDAQKDLHQIAVTTTLQGDCNSELVAMDWTEPELITDKE